jgi:glyceraldehyde 3-phosphate dehydrogenase
MVSFAINGFGRIGRCILRAYFSNDHHNILQCKVINIGVGDIENYLHLLKYDSTHGIFKNLEILDHNTIRILGQIIKIIKEPDPNMINWASLGADIVLECTGLFTQRKLAAQHINAGAKKVIVSAPCDEADITVVYGVNHHQLKDNHQVVSIGSCTTNCLAPIAKILNDSVGINLGFMTTVHAYTNDQNILDANHKDKRRARSAAISMIPSSTGAAKALGLVLPELAGKLDGVSIRVPVPNVSFIDLTFTSNKATNKEEINNFVRKVSADSMLGILEIVDDELVSIDFNNNPNSCIFDTTQTKVVGNNFCRIAAWYDNEWGFSNRMLDVAKLMNC